MANFNSWWCDDLSIFIGILSLIGSIFANAIIFYNSRQVKLSIIGDISPVNSSEVQITISNVGAVNARLGKIGIGFHAAEKWFKPKSGGMFETIFSQESLGFNPILAAGETTRINMDLTKVKKRLEDWSLDNYNKNTLSIDKLFGWVYLSRNKLSKNNIKSSDDRIKEIEDELNNQNIKRYPINFSVVLISTLSNHIEHYCKES